MNLSPEDLKRLAVIMEPSHQWLITDYGVTAFGFDKTRTTVKTAARFNPSLAGEDWQQAQACRVIVAADKLSGCFRCKSISEDDLLSAACAALLGSKE